MQCIFLPWRDRVRKQADQIPYFLYLKIGDEFGILRYSGGI
jgi:hypothetical protein